MRKMLLILLLCVSVVAAQVMTFFQKRIPTTTSTLMTGLLEHWDLDETSGTRYGYFAHDLTDNNTVLYGTGKYSNAADFEKDNLEHFSCADDDSLSFSSNFTVSAWIKTETNLNAGIVAKNSSGTAFEYLLQTFTDNYCYFVTGTNVSTEYNLIKSGSTINTGTWYCIVGWYNATTDSIYIQINDGTPTRAKSNHDVIDSNSSFYVGTFVPTNTSSFDGLIDLVSIWSRCPQASNGYAMADSIYNSGNGWRPGL